jgi:hypothetical protein
MSEGGGDDEVYKRRFGELGKVNTTVKRCSGLYFHMLHASMTRNRSRELDRHERW